MDDTVVSSHPDVQAAAAQLRQAFLTNARSTLIAPVTGYVAKRTVQLGQRVQPGTALMAVIPLDQLWIDANFKETQLRDMRIGQPVDIETDLYGSDVKYSGTIDSLGAGTGSAFALLPAQNATGNWIKIVQRVPVRIHINAQELASIRCGSACRPRSASTCTTRAARCWPSSHRRKLRSAPRSMTDNWPMPTR